jgi:hypothetical protein
LRDAAFLAKELGDSSKAQEFQREGDELLEWTKASYLKVMKDSLVDWIPNGPEDIHGTSMARGSSPGLWPGQVLDPNDKVVQTAFQRYYEKWIKPFRGAYFHQGRFWPYGFELAQCYTFLGQRDITNEILRWHLQHQTFPGVYSWAEQIDTTSLWFAAGDMPHCWVAADFMNALRACLLYEENDRVVLGAGIPKDRLRGGKTFSVENAPTFFGTVSYAVTVNPDGDRIVLQLTGPARPPAGFVLRLPSERDDIKAVTADGQAVNVEESGEILLGAGVKNILIVVR